MNIGTFWGFLDELQKIAYDPPEHTELGNYTTRAMGLGDPMGKHVVGGSLATDRGIRHPWIPTSDKLHAMPARPKKEIGQALLKQRNTGLRDITHGIAHSSDAHLARGLADFGQSQHGVMDLGAHYEKPKTLLAGSRMGSTMEMMRRGAQKLPGAGSAGFAISGLEHVIGGLGLKRTGLDPTIDKFHPRVDPIDRRSLNRAQGWGRTGRRDIIKGLVRDHGMTPAQAEQAYTQFAQRGPLSPVAKVVGSASRDARFIAQQAARPGRRAVTMLRKVLLRK